MVRESGQDPTVKHQSAPPGAISRRQAITNLCATSAGLLGTPFINRNRYHSLPGIPQDYSARAVRLVQDNLVIDLLNQFRFQDFADDPVKADFWRTHPHEFTVVDFEEYRTSGMNVFALGHARQSFEDAVQFFAEWNSDDR